MLGYACFGATPMTEAAYDLYWLVVAEAARGRGIGGALCAAVEDELKRTRRVTSSASRPRAWRGRAARAASTRRLGFRLAGAIPDFYRDGDDLLVFAKVL